jgi:glycosyl transferase, family 25
MQPCPILIINLPNSTDRRNAMAAQCARWGLAAEFVAAVDGRTMNTQQRAGHCAESFAAFHSPLTAAEVGCYLSHLKALERIVDQGWRWAVVLEDDVVLPADFVARLSVVCQEADTAFDLIKLNGHLPRRLVLQALSNGNCLVRYRRPPINANAHLWSTAGARKLLVHSRRVRRPIDVEIKHWWEMDLHIATLAPELVTLDPALCQASTIGTRNVRTPAGYYRKLRYNIAYSLASRWRTCRDTGWANGLRLLLPF